MLFCFLVRCVLLTPLAELAELKTILEFLLILMPVVIKAFALCALEFDEIILRHSFKFE